MTRPGLLLVFLSILALAGFAGCSKSSTGTPAPPPSATNPSGTAPTSQVSSAQAQAAKELPGKLQKGWDLLKQQKNQDAVSYFAGLSATYPRDYGVTLGLGTAYLTVGNLQKADETLQKAISLNSGDPGAHMQMGNLRLRENRPDDARIEYSAAVAANPPAVVKSDALTGIGNTYLAANQPEEAGKQFTQALQLNPSNYGAYLGMGQVYQAKGDKAKASESLEKALSLNPSIPNADQIRKTIQQLKGK